MTKELRERYKDRVTELGALYLSGIHVRPEQIALYREYLATERVVSKGDVVLG